MSHDKLEIEEGPTMAPQSTEIAPTYFEGSPLARLIQEIQIQYPDWSMDCIPEESESPLCMTPPKLNDVKTRRETVIIDDTRVVPHLRAKHRKVLSLKVSYFCHDLFCLAWIMLTHEWQFTEKDFAFGMSCTASPATSRSERVAVELMTHSAIGRSCVGIIILGNATNTTWIMRHETCLWDGGREGEGGGARVEGTSVVNEHKLIGYSIHQNLAM